MSSASLQAARTATAPEILDMSRCLQHISIVPCGLRLDTRGEGLTAPMLRGVWGAALHGVSREVYDTVFAPDAEGSAFRAPGFLLRLVDADPRRGSELEWTVIGGALAHWEVLTRAWDLASRMGLGRRRVPFRIEQVWGRTADGGRSETIRSWTLASAVWPVPGEPSKTPVHLHFRGPVRMMRHGKLIYAPTLADIVVAACRRIAMYLPGEVIDDWQVLTRKWIDEARQLPCLPWQGRRCDLHRYSARQKVDLELRGVSGTLSLPGGAGNCWPLLAAARWLHVGKGTAMGMGHFEVEPWQQGDNGE